MTSIDVYMLDTNTAAYLLDGRSQAAWDELERVGMDARICMSAISQGEFLYGLEKKPASITLRVALEDFLEDVEILSWDTAAAIAYGRLRFTLQKAGKTLAANDLLIASHAIAVGATLVTHDKAFRYASPFLNVVDWATDL